jgi:GMP synthase (glutamine-hydrolysing)
MRFQAMLKILVPTAVVKFAFPADHDTLLPTKKQLEAFDGVLWTGSSLSVNDSAPAVQRQLTFAADVFNSGVTFYGSCWGLQVAAVVAGGKVDTCTKGWEFGISNPVRLTAEGKNHPCFRGRKGSFSVLVVHKDEVVMLPKNSTVLAENNHSKVQAMTIRHGKSEFFGVQYHPEFIASDMAFIARRRSGILVNEGVFRSKQAVEAFALKLETKTDLPSSVTDYMLHVQEVNHWLSFR